jgi:hypothetical protein
MVIIMLLQQPTIITAAATKTTQLLPILLILTIANPTFQKRAVVGYYPLTPIHYY